MSMKKTFLAAVLTAACGASALAAPTVARVDAADGLKPLAMSVGGRVAGEGSLKYQWPGAYFETAFDGSSAYFTLGPGDVILHVLVDGQALAPMVKPAPGTYRIGGLAAGAHSLRIEVATESQAGPNVFGGFSLPKDGKAGALPQRSRRIEFIGDSHTVGYGNTSPTRDCSNDDVWKTTDNTQAFGPVAARHYGADYRVHAISGRGIVRNYDGFTADQLPLAYPYTLFDHSATADGALWQPQVIVIALGTNDFTTPLRDAERWKTRAELHADYQATYVKFVQSLRAHNPKAYFVLWSTDMAGGEIADQVRKVAEQLKAGGERRLSYVPVQGLTMGGCHYHPSVDDDKTIAQALIKVIDAQPDVWGGR